MRTKINLFYPVLFCFFNFGNFCSLVMASPSDHVQESRQTRGLLWKLGRQDSEELSLVQQIKYGHGVGGRGAGGSTGGGYAGGASGKGNGGGSGSGSSDGCAC
ncbi:hypothetical protein Leryth_024380 [Lithospermum erythrorhizon]|nr:hypothetical protein Leryth_024380 [Lithospermum erythrorhizon]